MSSIDPFKLQEIIDKKVNELTSPGGPFPIVETSVCGGQRNVNVIRRDDLSNLTQYVSTFLGIHGNKEFIVFSNERYTYTDARRIVESIAKVLTKRFGVRKGQYVGIAMRNLPEWCFSFMAICWVGAIPVALHSLWSPPELEYGIIDSGISLLFCDHERFLRVLPTLKKQSTTSSSRDSLLRCVVVRHTNIIEEWQDRVFAWSDLLKEGSTDHHFHHPPAEVHPDDTAVMMYTSGSTGKPKGVVLMHRSFANAMLMNWLSLEVREIILSQSVPPSPPPPYQPCIILCLPLFHVTALNHVFLPCLLKGTKLVMLHKWDPAAALAAIQRERVTYFIGVPTMAQDLLEHPDFAKTDVSSLQQIGGGGAATPPSLAAKMNTAMGPSVWTGQGYGLTETTCGVVLNSGPMYVVKPKSTGRPGPLIQVKVVDLETGEDLPIGCRGELLIKSVMVMKEYFNKPVETSKTIISVKGDPGWLRTGDIAELDQDGFIYIVDRAKEIIIRGGENISCVEVEMAFYEHPAVMECAAVPVAHSRLGEVVGLAVVPKAGFMLNVEELLSSVKDKLAAFKIPESKFVFLSSTPLPRGATGKINKLVLKQLLATLTGKL